MSWKCRPAAVAILLSALSAASTSRAQQPPPPMPPPPPEAYAPPPPPPMPAEPARQRNSTGMMITGISLTATGAIAAAIGVALIAQANEGLLHQCGEKTCDPQQQRINGALLAGAGGVGVAVGVPLIVVGARKVTVAPGAPNAAAGASLRASF